MRWVAPVALLVAAGAHATTFFAQVPDAAAWEKLLGSVSIVPSATPRSDVVVITGDSVIDVATIAQQQFVIVEGTGPATEELGFRAKGTIPTRHIVDSHAPTMPIYWAEAEQVAQVQLPEGWQVFAHERWSGAPVLAGKRCGQGALLWLATSPGPTGIERFPYVLQAASDLGLSLPMRATSLWAFFDSAYRIRADVNYLASRWRKAGIGVLHVAAWHTMEPDKAADEYLHSLIEACHRNSILVYAWLELPHVSERFWADHPEWREKTAIGQDAQLDWRKLMNLENPDCRQAVEQQVSQLLSRFDWDGVNIAELYFESLEGAANPARFTPMNQDVRRAFQAERGFDPKLLFEAGSAHSAGTHPQDLRTFLDYRATLAARMQNDWLQAMDRIKKSKPHLDVVLTHIDDRFEPGMRDALGADVARVLPILEKRHNTMLVEDPATLWNLGPERYAKLQTKYSEITSNRGALAVDINVVERYQDVYPTKKQTGGELLELVHQAAVSFHRVALYVESSIEKQDLSLLPAAAVSSQLKAISADELQLEGDAPVRIAWLGPVEVDGKPWPVRDGATVLVPGGKHRLAAGISDAPLRLTDFNGEILAAAANGADVDLSYANTSRALARVVGPLTSIELDGAPFPMPSESDGSLLLRLPPGQHLLTLHGKP